MNSSHLSEKIRTIEKVEPDLKVFAEKYPWCSLAQLSLLRQHQKNNSDQFNQQAGKTALFFNDQNWLKWQLHLLSTQPDTPIENDQIQNSNESITVETIEEKAINTSTTGTDDNFTTKESESIIEFEPLHTTDYFASQGIKITDEAVTQDKLGTQMKSFTEWLKSMKKIHKETLPTGRQDLPAGDEQTDKSIQQIAEHSNEAAEVVTESMADILLKQGKREKAIEVYHKLSLINPSKSAYFAAKIEGLSSEGRI